MKNKLGWLVAVLALPSVAVADDASMFKFSGFGTVGMTYSGESDADYHTGYNQMNGPGATDKMTWDTDSKFGVQADAFLIPNKLTATVQVLADQNGDKTFTPGLEWANLKWQIADNWYVRGGRVVAPTFMMSESRSVGYTQTTIRPPSLVYSSNPITFVDGIDTGYQFGVGESLVNLQLTYGKYDEDTLTLGGGTTFSNKIDSLIFSTNVEYGDLNVRLGLAKYEMEISSAIVTNYLNALDLLIANGIPDADVVKSRNNLKDSTANIAGLGFSYDPGDWMMQGEVTLFKTSAAQVRDMTSGYLLAGKRMGKWTPYGMISMTKTSTDDLPLMNPATAGPLAPVVIGINASSQGIMTKVDQTTFTVGVRYDVYKNMALKAQWDHIQKPANSFGEFVNINGTTPTNPSYATSFVQEKRSVDLIGLAVDFVF